LFERRLRIATIVAREGWSDQNEHGHHKDRFRHSTFSFLIAGTKLLFQQEAVCLEATIMPAWSSVSSQCQVLMAINPAAGGQQRMTKQKNRDRPAGERFLLLRQWYDSIRFRSYARCAGLT
jgi:hypothetical protein